MTNRAAATIAEAVAALARDNEIPEPFIRCDTVEGRYGPFTRTVITLPNADADDLVIADDDNTAVVTRRTTSGVVLDIVRLSNPRLPIMHAVLQAFVTESLADPA